MAGLSVAQRIARLTAEQRRSWVAQLDEELLEEVTRREWWYMARPEQLEPEGHWRIWVVQAGRGWGKLLSVDTPIPTPSGWTTMGGVRVGDKVLDESGRPCRVSWVSETQYEDTYRVRFSDGTSLLAHGQHQWVTWTHAERKAFLRSPYENPTRFPDEWPAWRLRRRAGGRQGRKNAPIVADDSPGPQIRTTEQIRATLTYGKRDALNHCVPAALPLQLPECELPVDPYVLGVWLGDGDTAGGAVTMAAEDAAVVRPLVEAAGWATKDYVVGEGHTPRFAIVGLSAALRDAGVLRDKHVPAAYLRASQEQRLALLQGLMDTDGGPDGGAVASRVSFTTTLPALADAVYELTVGLGMVARRDQRPAKLHGVAHGTAYRVRFTPTQPVFRLPRKAERLTLRAQQLRARHRMITAVERVPTVPMRCITVDSPHSMYLAGEAMIPTHNTATGAEWLVQQMLDHPVDMAGHATEWGAFGETFEDCRTLMIEGPSGLANVLRRRGIRFRYVQHPRPRIWLASGQRIHFQGAQDGDVGRGLNLAGAWLDELAKWPKPGASWVEGIAPALRVLTPTGGRPRVVVTTTPKPIKILADWTGRADKSVHVTRGSTFDNAANLSPDALAELVSQYTDAAGVMSRIGRQELFGELLTDIEGALWRTAWLEATRVAADKVPQLLKIVVAVDPAVSDSPDADETGIVIVGRGVDGHDYVLADRSAKVVGIEAARRAWQAYLDYEADTVVYEDNQGQDWVRDVLRTAWNDMQAEELIPQGNAPIKAVRAMRGKRLRAEPIAARYETGKVHHVGVDEAGRHALQKLETQMTEWLPSSGTSPDRLDALVHACAALKQTEAVDVPIVSPVGQRDPVAAAAASLGVNAPKQVWNPGQGMRRRTRGGFA